MELSIRGQIIFCALSLMAIIAFKVPNDPINAIVEEHNGLYVFILSKPTMEHKILGTVSKSFALTGQPGEMLDSMIKKVKKEYPKSDGIVFTSIAMDKADAIQFK